MKRGAMPLLMSLTVSAARPAGGFGLFSSAWPFVAQELLAAIAELGQYGQMAGILVLMLIGAPDVVLQTLILFGMVLSLFQYANADIRYDGWSLIFSTADLHRWHHAADGGVEPCNFGGVLILWDQVFGTYRRGAAPQTVGIAGVPALPSSSFGAMRGAMRRATATTPRP